VLIWVTLESFSKLVALGGAVRLAVSAGWHWLSVRKLLELGGVTGLEKAGGANLGDAEEV